MAQPPELTAPASQRHHPAAPIHLLLCAAIAVGVTAAMARPNREAGEPPSPTLEAALPQAVRAELLDVLAEGPLVSSAYWQPHVLDVTVEGALVSAALSPPAP
jgi:hypothetical protein